MPKTVWIVNEAGHDYDRAKDIAGSDCQFSYLTEDNINPHRVDRLSKHIARGVIRFAKKDDYILISGTPMVNALAVLIWLKHFKTCSVLQWDAKGRKYTLTTLDMDHLERMMQGVLEG